MEPPTRPPQPTSEPPSPFHPGEPRRGGGAGRTRPLLIGCGVVFLLLGIAAVVAVVKMPDLVQWVFHRLEQQVMTQLPPDVTPEERRRLDAAFDDAARAIASNTADPGEAQKLNSVLMDFSSPNREVSREKVLELLEALEKTAGTRPPET